MNRPFFVHTVRCEQNQKGVFQSTGSIRGIKRKKIYDGSGHAGVFSSDVRRAVHLSRDSSFREDPRRVSGDRLARSVFAGKGSVAFFGGKRAKRAKERDDRAGGYLLLFGEQFFLSPASERRDRLRMFPPSQGLASARLGGAFNVGDDDRGISLSGSLSGRRMAFAPFFARPSRRDRGIRYAGSVCLSRLPRVQSVSCAL